MRVELLVNLKADKNWRKGEIVEFPLPPDLQKEVSLDTGTVRVLEDEAEKPNAPSKTVNENPEPPDEPPVEKTEKEDDLESGIKGAKAGQKLRESLKPPAEKLDTIIEQTCYPKLAALIKQEGSIAATARALGVAAATVSNWKKGKTKPHKPMIAKISRMVRNDESRADDTGDAGSQGT